MTAPRAGAAVTERPGGLWAALRRRLRRLKRREWVKWARQPVSCWAAVPFAVGGVGLAGPGRVSPGRVRPRGGHPRSATDTCNAALSGGGACPRRPACIAA